MTIATSVGVWGRTPYDGRPMGDDTIAWSAFVPTTNAACRCMASAVRLALQAVRASLSFDDALSVASHLPLHYRRLFVEDWPPSNAPRLLSRADFLQRIGGPEDPLGPGEFLARAALARVRRDLPRNAQVAIRELLPAHLRVYWRDPGPRPSCSRPRDARPAEPHLRLVSESRRAS